MNKNEIIPIVLVEKNTLNWYITRHGYINIHHSPFIGPIKINRKFWKITPLIIMEVPKWKVLISIVIFVSNESVGWKKVSK